MVNITYNFLKENGLIIFEAIRGSKCQGLDTPSSDEDHIVVYMCPKEQLYSLRDEYDSQISEDKNNIVCYEIGRYLELLAKSNPTVLESLFIDDEFILYEHPLFKDIRLHKDQFITKACFNAFYSYSSSQIKKCMGYNKLCTNPVKSEGKPLDFCYTFCNQGSTKLIDWLNNRGLCQKYCGLVKIPNMHDVYGVYYDWKADFEDNGWSDLSTCMQKCDEKKFSLFRQTVNNIVEVFQHTRLGYSGIVAEDGSSKEVRYIQANYSDKDGIMLNSVAKDAKPICFMSYNAEGYAKHQRDYTRYQKWLKERNEERYQTNSGYNFDSKNVENCVRLVNMAIEIAKGEGVKLNRRNIDREFLLDIKNHKYAYDEIIKILETKDKEMHDAVKICTLPEEVDKEQVGRLLIDIRNKFYDNKED